MKIFWKKVWNFLVEIGEDRAKHELKFGSYY